MRISFLCISLEPGRNGVGDYVRQFARNLTREGHACQVLALADPFITAPVKSLEDGYEVARLPVALWSRGETRWAEDSLTRFEPNWVSLQMVCYGYENRGLLLRSGGLFEKLSRIGSRHMMFHELWIGESSGVDFLTRSVGYLQRRLLLRATRRWGPRTIHTNNAVYRELLARAGIRAGLLPLPGNVPVTDSMNPHEARRWLAEKLGLNDRSAILAGVFGSIHPEWRDPRWLEAVVEWGRQLGRRAVVIQIGRAGNIGESIWTSLQEQFRGRAEMYALGPLSPEEVSRALLALDFGVATSPWALIGKSGSAAAMLDHGLPVVVSRDDFKLRSGATPEPESHPLLVRFEDVGTYSRLDEARRAYASRRDRDIYRSFVESLQAAS